MSGGDPRLPTSSGDYGDKYQDHVLDLYKLFVELADRTQQRRINATSSDVLLVTNTLVAVLAAAGEKATKLGFPSLILGVSGLLLCLAWAQRVGSYRALAYAKFSVLSQIEALLPLQPYDMEWQVVSDRMRRTPLWRLVRPNMELLLPWLFATLHLALIIVAVVILI